MGILVRHGCGIAYLLYSSGVGQLAHAEVVDDEQGHAGQLGQVVLAGLGEGRPGELPRKVWASR